MNATRNTRQRVIVLQSVQECRNHPTADEIYAEVSRRDAHISRATVYRNLTMLSDLGEILRVRVPDGADRFDFWTEPHYHLRCKSCGRVFDVDMPAIDGLTEQIRDLHGFTVDSYEIIFSGCCPDCQQN